LHEGFAHHSCGTALDFHQCFPTRSDLYNTFDRLRIFLWLPRPNANGRFIVKEEKQTLPKLHQYTELLYTDHTQCFLLLSPQLVATVDTRYVIPRAIASYISDNGLGYSI
jgi:hypothetical protein